MVLEKVAPDKHREWSDTPFYKIFHAIGQYLTTKDAQDTNWLITWQEMGIYWRQIQICIHINNIYNPQEADLD